MTDRHLICFQTYWGGQVDRRERGCADGPDEAGGEVAGEAYPGEEWSRKGNNGEEEDAGDR